MAAQSREVGLSSRSVFAVCSISVIRPSRLCSTRRTFSVLLCQQAAGRFKSSRSWEPRRRGLRIREISREVATDASLAGLGRPEDHELFRALSMFCTICTSLHHKAGWFIDQRTSDPFALEVSQSLEVCRISQWMQKLLRSPSGPNRAGALWILVLAMRRDVGHAFDVA